MKFINRYLFVTTFIEFYQRFYEQFIVKVEFCIVRITHNIVFYVKYMYRIEFAHFTSKIECIIIFYYLIKFDNFFYEFRFD